MDACEGGDVPESANPLVPTDDAPPCIRLLQNERGNKGIFR